MKLFQSLIFGVALSISLKSLLLQSGTKLNFTRRLATTLKKVASPKFNIVMELSPIKKSKQPITYPTFDYFAEIVCRSISYMSRVYKII